MSQIINKDLLKHLAGLGRLKLEAKETTKFLRDFENILNYFKQLEEVDTANIEPMIGGTNLKNIFREDEISLDRRAQTVSDTGRLIDAFPNKEKSYNRVPKILE